jgi:hypothetical protein
MTYDIVERLLHWYTVFPCDVDKPEGNLYVEAANEIASLRAEVARLEAYITPADDALISLSTLLIACDEMQESDIQEGGGDSPVDHGSYVARRMVESTVTALIALKGGSK